MTRGESDPFRIEGEAQTEELLYIQTCFHMNHSFHFCRNLNLVVMTNTI